MKRIYLDHNATTPVDTRVLEAILPYFTTKFGNASSVHQLGQEAHAAMNLSRIQISKLLHCNPDEIIFTSGGTESNNIAIQGTVRTLAQKGNHIITSVIEHPAVLNTCQYLETTGCKITYLPVDGTGLVNPDDVKQSITNQTILITLMYVNNEIGTIQPIEEIGRIAKEYEIRFHTDAVQAAGKIPLDVQKLNVDLLSISGHKFYAPKGTGALYIRDGVKLSPVLFGGHHEHGIKPGTESITNIVGLGKATEIAIESMNIDSIRIGKLRDRLFDLLSSSIQDIRLNGHPTHRIFNTLNLSFDKIDGATLVLNLDLDGISCSTGSACSEGSTEISHVIKALHTPAKFASGSVRFSLGKSNTEPEIDIVHQKLATIIKRLRFKC